MDGENDEDKPEDIAGETLTLTFLKTKENLIMMVSFQKSRHFCAKWIYLTMPSTKSHHTIKAELSFGPTKEEIV